MKWTEIPAGELHAAEQRLRVALGDEADRVVKRINTDLALVNLIAGQILKMTEEIADKQLTSLNPQWLRAREIMGRNMFGVEEAIQYFGVNPTQKQLATLAEVPYSEAVLEQCKDTHILVAVVPLSILDIRGKVAGGQCLFYEQDWYNRQPFAKDKGEVGWKLVRKTPVENSTSKTWEEQQALLTDQEETPSAQVMTYTIVGRFLATGERLFEHIYVRTSSVVSGGHRVDVGSFDAKGLYVSHSWDGNRHVGLGVSSARKF